MKILYLLIAVLKFLGIAILIVLLLLLLLVLIILTVPIKYRIYINKSDETYALASLRWLYFVAGMDIIYESGSEITTKFKLFGKVVGAKKPKKYKQSKQKDVRKSDHHIAMDKTSERLVTKEQDKKEDKKENIKKSNKTTKSKKSKKKKGGLKEIIAQIQSFYYKKQLLADTINWIGKVFKRIWPSAIYMEIEVGKEDPADTGQLIALLSAFYPLHYSFASIIGNYEKECFYAKIDAKGDIVLGKLVYDFIKYIRTTSAKQLIKFIRKIRKGK